MKDLLLFAVGAAVGAALLFWAYGARADHSHDPDSWHTWAACQEGPALEGLKGVLRRDLGGYEAYVRATPGCIDTRLFYQPPLPVVLMDLEGQETMADGQCWQFWRVLVLPGGTPVVVSWRRVAPPCPANPELEIGRKA